MKTGKPSITALFSLTKVALVAAAFASCNNAFDSGSASGSAPSGAASSSATGIINIQLPAIASCLQSAGADQGAASASKSKTGGRAIALITGYKVEVKNASGGDVITPLTVSYAASFTTSSNPIAVPAGGPYTVKVSVYNDNTSSTAPTVEGTATGVYVAGGANTEISITCFPAATTPLSVDAAALSETFTHYYERWYTVDLAAGTLYYFQTGNPATVGLLYSSAGTLISSGTYFEYTPSAGGRYYFAWVGVASVPSTSTLKVSTIAPVLSEGTALNPISLGLNTDHLFKVGPYGGSQAVSYYSFTADAAGSYALTSSANTTPYYLELYSDKYSTLVDKSSSLVKGKVWDGLVSGHEYFFKLTLSPGPSSAPSFSGLIMDPPAIAAYVPQSEGTSTVPIELAVGGTSAVKVGPTVFDYTSYYHFKTGASIDYSITVSAIPSYGEILFVIGTANSSTGSPLEKTNMTYTLLPNTDYYIQLISYSSAVESFSLTIDT